ncbi:MAG: ester cyclase [Armatimonadota bacterium]|nr:ester cyclase [Armatimonadota bacterium]MDR7448703.1 ester cyclase [Armatimonadota bacterium]MDR7460277.1 ester cyclase [Armatimonadota bacterium]MDR7479041.1 ester cyclase [Armatimonadota bacterium]MDR7502672.1 ester cyclase [Armatimonadota bacterium]
MSRDPRTVVQHFLDEILNGKDLDAANELISSPILRHRVMAFLQAFPDLEVTPTLLVTEANIVGARLLARGTHHGLFQGVPPTGKRWTATCCGFYHVQGQQIVESWVNWDLLAILEQIGGIRRAPAASA